jgi:hypothetical protein
MGKSIRRKLVADTRLPTTRYDRLIICTDIPTHVSAGVEARAGFPAAYREGKKDYHKWRALTALTFAKYPPSKRFVKAKIDDLHSDILKRVRKLATDNSDSLDKELRLIVERAVEVDLSIRGQLAVFQPVRLRSGSDDKLFDFHPTEDEGKIYRETRRAHREELVVLIVSPGLYKYGDSDGNNYDQQSILEPCELCTNRSLDEGAQLGMTSNHVSLISRTRTSSHS